MTKAKEPVKPHAKPKPEKESQPPKPSHERHEFKKTPAMMGPIDVVFVPASLCLACGNPKTDVCGACGN